MSEALTEQEFQKLSLNFRRVASRFLNTKFDDYQDSLKRFLIFIEDSPTISEFIQENNTKTFDIEKVIEARGYHDRFKLPIRESDEIAFVYQMLRFISDNERDIIGLTFGYSSSNKIQAQVEEFNNHVVKPLVDHIVNYLGELKIDMGLDKKSSTNYHIGDFRGQLNHAEGQGRVTANQTYNETKVEGLKEVVEKFVEELQKHEEIPDDEKEETVEFLEAAVQEAESEKPKKAIMNTAMGKVRGINEIASAGTTLFTLGTQLVDSLGGFIG